MPSRCKFPPRLPVRCSLPLFGGSLDLNDTARKGYGHRMSNIRAFGGLCCPSTDLQ